MQIKKIIHFAWVIVLIMFYGCTDDANQTDEYFEHSGLNKLEYNNPEILVDLDVGFKAIPMPMDFDGDGDYDLLLSQSHCYVESGVVYFENISGNIDMPVFRRRMKVSTERFRLGYEGASFVVSNVNDRIHVLTPDNVREKLLIYKDVPQNVFWDRNEILLPFEGYQYLHNYKYTEWKMIDFYGDGTSDLVCAARSPRLADIRGAGADERIKSIPADLDKSQLIFLKNIGNDSLPEFEDPVMIKKENGQSLAAGLSINPLFADFDNDGDYDFIGIARSDFNDEYGFIGEEIKTGYFIYFENAGTSSEYKFTNGKVMTYNGKPIQMVSSFTSGINARVVDWNKNGFADIIAGDEDGKISYLKNTGKIIDGVPEFLPPQFFQQEAKYVDFGALAAPRVFDWDGDGLDDIISGNGVGNIGFIKNLGGRNPKWAAPVLLEVNDQPIRILPEGAYWGYTSIDVADWNHNGLPDILVNHHHGNVLWFENVGTPTKPELAGAKPIEVNWEGEPLIPDWVPGKQKGNELLAPWRTSPLVMDFTENGLNDLVMLDHEGYLAVYPREEDIDGKLILLPPERNFIYESGEAIRLNQREGSSSGRLKITFADWDGDGMKDLIFSSKPAVDWMKNMGMKDGKMVLKYMGRVLSKTLMGHTDGPVVCDWNKNGVPDLLVGTESGVLYYWERPDFEITTTMTTTGRQTPANYKYFKR